jgi:ribose 5-phosphate isomerase B
MKDMEDTIKNWNKKEQKIGIAADQGGFELKQFLTIQLDEVGYKVKDFGNKDYNKDDDYPDYILPLAQAIRNGEIDKGIAVCGSGVGASIAANKVDGVRACVIHDTFSAHQGVEDDNMNMICLGGRIIGHSLAWEVVDTFLSSTFSNAERHLRRLKKVKLIEKIYDENSFKSSL